MLGWGLREVARPFFSVAPITAASTVVGAVSLDALPGRPLVGVLLAGAVTVVVYVLLLRVFARGIIDDALGILPLPARYVALAGRLLGLGPRAVLAQPGEGTSDEAA
jgi:hypothetical protein